MARETLNRKTLETYTKALAGDTGRKVELALCIFKDKYNLDASCEIYQTQYTDFYTQTSINQVIYVSKLHYEYEGILKQKFVPLKLREHGHPNGPFGGEIAFVMNIHTPVKKINPSSIQIGLGYLESDVTDLGQIAKHVTNQTQLWPFGSGEIMITTNPLNALMRIDGTDYQSLSDYALIGVIHRLYGSLLYEFNQKEGRIMYCYPSNSMSRIIYDATTPMPFPGL